MIKRQIIKLIEKITGEKSIHVERPGNPVYGDYTTNIAIVLKKNPSEITDALVKSKKEKIFFDKIEAKNGFINFFLSKNYLQEQVGEILKQGDKFGRVNLAKTTKDKPEKVNIEFISANPTGPLTLGNGRGGFCGDVLSNVLEKAGYKVVREYYINNIGEQIRGLGHSVLGDKEAVYKGDYIVQLKKEIREKDINKAGEKAAEFILERIIKPSIERMGIRFDVWFSEKSLYEAKGIEKILKIIEKKGLIYKKDGALWFKSSLYGDDKDRVLMKANGETTYLTPDIAYLNNKIKRGFGRLIYFLGADHYGYIGRIKAAAQALDFDKEKVTVIIMQMVRLFKEGKEVKMSKRAGTYLTVDELISEVGLDATRFFFLTKSPETHLDFNLDLAKKQSEKNPVYYIQYAHARICSILRKNQKPKIKSIKPELKLLNHVSELTLIRQLIRFPEIVEDTAKDCQVQKIPQYSLDLAKSFHQFYRDCRILEGPVLLRQSRLALVLATKIVIKNTLDLMGISSPEKM